MNKIDRFRVLVYVRERETIEWTSIDYRYSIPAEYLATEILINAFSSRRARDGFSASLDRPAIGNGSINYASRDIRKRELSTFGAKRNHGTLGLALMHFPLSNLAFGPDALESDYTLYSPRLLRLRLRLRSLPRGLLLVTLFASGV